jgi:RNA polymerase sigma-70 factor (ECF subfamily)
MLSPSRSLLERLHDNSDQQAWQRFLAIYQPWLRGWLSRTDLQPADVDDVLQEVLAAMSGRMADFIHNGRPGAFRAWPRTILTNKLRQLLRGQRTRQGMFASPPLADWLDQLADPNSALSAQWDQEHDQHLVRRTLASIQGEFNESTWRVFQMAVLEERPTAEVARTLGITANAVYVAKSRVLSRLRLELRGLMDI